MDRRATLKKHAGMFLLAASVWLIWVMVGLECPILTLFHVPCPTCGFTRAWVLLFQGQWQASLQMHPMAVPLTLALVLAFHLKILPKKAKLPAWIFLAGVLTINLIVYILRLMGR